MRNMHSHKKGDTTVFIADDHPLIRFSLCLSFEDTEGIRVIGEAIDGNSAIEKITKNPPDVALVDVDMPGLSGAGAIRILRRALPMLKILVLSTYHHDEYIRETMDAGADGYILKNVNVDELARIIKSYAASTSIASS